MGAMRLTNLSVFSVEKMPTYPGYLRTGISDLRNVKQSVKAMTTTHSNKPKAFLY